MSALPLKSHLSRLETDPLRNFKFLVNIEQPVQHTNNGPFKTIGFSLGFTSVSGFSATTNAIPYRQGGYNTAPQMIPGQTSFTPLTLSRGVLIVTPQNWDWFRQLFSVTLGNGSWPGSNGKTGGFRATVTVYVMPHPRADQSSFVQDAYWKVYNCWPTSIAFGELNAGDNAFLVETMVLAHEGWEYHLDTQYKDG